MKTNILFFIKPRSVLLGMKNVSDKRCRENRSTHFVVSDFFFFENPAVYEIMCKNIVERGRPHMTKWRMRISRWVPKATNTYSQYVILICFSTATMVARTRLSVTLYVHCLYCYPFGTFLP